MTWPEMCRSEEYRGRWVALDNILYEPSSTHPQEADIVDSDEDLNELCSRMREADAYARSRSNGMRHSVLSVRSAHAAHQSAYSRRTSVSQRIDAPLTIV